MKVLSDIIKYAIKSHYGQRRKFTGERYTVHCAEVVGTAVEHYYLVADQVSLHVFMAVGWCHDLIEDCGVTEQDLIELAKDWSQKDRDDFVLGVRLLSDGKEGNRAERNFESRERLKSAPLWVQLIKLADLGSNTRCISIHDPHFFTVYSIEKMAILDSLIAIPDDIRERAKMELQALIDAHARRADCPKCGEGKMHARTTRIGYLDKRGVGRYIENAHGMHCTACDHAVILEPETAHIISKRIKSGGKVPFSNQR